MAMGMEHKANSKSRALCKRSARMPKGSHKVSISWMGTSSSNFSHHLSFYL